MCEPDVHVIGLDFECIVDLPLAPAKVPIAQINPD